jgi:hypothetical protein
MRRAVRVMDLNIVDKERCIDSIRDQRSIGMGSIDWFSYFVESALGKAAVAFVVVLNED